MAENGPKAAKTALSAASPDCGVAPSAIRAIVEPIVADSCIEAVAPPPADHKMALPGDIVARLRTRRRALRLHQVHLARRIGVSKDTLGRWERRKADPTLGGLCAWAECLRMEVALLDKDPTP